MDKITITILHSNPLIICTTNKQNYIARVIIYAMGYGLSLHYCLAYLIYSLLVISCHCQLEWERNKKFLQNV